MEFPPIIVIVGSYFGMAAGVWALFDRADKALNEAAKKSIAEWLQNINPTTERSRWPGQFIEIFDSVFGEKHLSWKCFFRSCLASIFSVTVVLIIYLGVGEDFILVKRPWQEKIILYMFVAGILLNLIPDYFSLLETRFLLHWLRKSASYLKSFSLMFLDILITFFIFYGTIIIYLSLSALTPNIDISPGIFEATWVFIPYSLTFSGMFPFLGIYLYSTFFTSVWIWLYVLSGFLIKISQRSGRFIKMLRSFLDVKNKPLPSLGFASNLIILILYVIGCGFFYDGEYW